MGWKKRGTWNNREKHGDGWNIESADGWWGGGGGREGVIQGCVRVVEG